MEMAKQFIGGRGLGARLLWNMVGPEVDRWRLKTCSSLPTAR